MKGHVDHNGRALLPISIHPSAAMAAHEVLVWVDMGFNGDLVLPQRQIDELALIQSGTVKAVLADGSKVALNVYTCVVN